MNRKILAGAAVVMIGLCALAASQSRMVQNLYYAMTYERTLDRYDQVDTTSTDVTSRVGSDRREANLVSAFFGIDDALPRILADRAICEGASGQDGMPVIFSHEVDVTTVEPGDFEILRASGERGGVTCLTLAPADGPGELRTVLLAGQFGSEADPPLRVTITGNILSLDGSANFRGAEVEIVPLADGPSIVMAETVPADQWTLEQRATSIPFGGGSGCPAGTSQVLRVVWNGGVTKPDGTPADEQEGRLYEVTVQRSDGAPETVTAMALADTGDGDNNHKLCLETTDPVVSVSFPAGYVTDPRDDLNPATSVLLSN